METTPRTGPDIPSYTDAGEGAPVVLLHGFPVDRTMWDAQIKGLSENYRVIAPDIAGFGGDKSTNDFSIESLADDVYALLGRLGALPCTLGGFSMGGYVALAFANKYPDELRGLILIDTKASADTAEGKAGRDKMIESAKASGAPAIAEQMLPKMLAPGTIEHRPEIVQRVTSLIHACRTESIARALVAMRDRPDRTDELPSIAVPTLIVVGDSDAVTPPKVAEAMKKAIPGSTLEVIRGAGHLSPVEQAEQVTQAIERWLMPPVEEPAVE